MLRCGLAQSSQYVAMGSLSRGDRIFILWAQPKILVARWADVTIYADQVNISSPPPKIVELLDFVNQMMIICLGKGAELRWDLVNVE